MVKGCHLDGKLLRCQSLVFSGALALALLHRGMSVAIVPRVNRLMECEQ